MTDSNPPLGRYYHEVYLAPSPIEEDRRSFRVRYAFLIDQYDTVELWKFVVGATGIEAFKPIYHTTPSFRDSVLALPFPDLLKVVHAVVRYLREEARSNSAWRTFLEEHIRNVQSLLAEERMAWVMDNHGGLHPLRDAVYSQQRQSAIQGLSIPRFSNARAEFEKYIDAFDNGEPDNKLAIRHIFQTVEALFKLRYEPAPPERLVEAEVRKRLGADFQRVKGQYEPNRYTKTANAEMVDAFVHWVVAAQQYRHEQGVADGVDQPPDDVTELLVTTGMSFIRWLIRIDSSA